MVNAAKNLMLWISNQCEMLRGVYPERGMKGILPPIHCIGFRMTSKEPAVPSTPLRDSERSRTVSEANGAQHDRFDFFSSPPVKQPSGGIGPLMTEPRACLRSLTGKH